MKLEKIDLYEEFGLERKESQKGYLTCYLPDNSREINPNRKHPSILIIPGGAYMFVSFREAEPIALKFLAEGYNAFVLDYSIAPDDKYPTPLNEALMAVAYINRNAEKLNTSKELVSGIGFSAGGNLLGLLVTASDEELKNVSLSRDETRLYGAVFSYSVLSSKVNLGHAQSFRNLTGGDEKLTESLSIENRDFSYFPPSFIWATKNDNVVPYMNSVVLSEILSAKGIENECMILESGPHGGSVWDYLCYSEQQMKDFAFPPDNKKWVGAAFAFLNKVGIKIVD